MAIDRRELQVPITGSQDKDPLNNTSVDCRPTLCPGATRERKTNLEDGFHKGGRTRNATATECRNVRKIVKNEIKLSLSVLPR